MKPSQVVDALQILTNKDVMLPCFIHGSPGLGKSSLVKQVAEKNNLEIRDVRTVLLDACDIKGIPTISGKQGEKVTEWCPPDFLPTSGEGILFLDELSQAPQMVQSSCLQLVLDRCIGNYRLPDGWRIVAAGNKQSDKAGSSKIITPLLNRFVHLELDPCSEEWLTWAEKADINAQIRYYIKWKPAHLMSFDPKISQRSFASPRTWEYLSKILTKTGHINNSLMHLIEGAIGNVSAEFTAFLALRDKLPDIERIMKDPEGTPVPVNEGGVLYALAGALEEKAMDPKNHDSFMKYSTRLPKEFSVLVIRNALANAKCNLSSSHPLVHAWWEKNKEFIRGPKN